MVSLLRLPRRAPLCLLSVALATVGLTGCEGGGDQGDASGSTSNASSSTDDPSTTAVASTGATTAESSSSSSTDDGTTGSSTTADTSSSTTDEESSSSSTGEVCLPGTANCPCDAEACEGELVCTDGTCFNPSGCQGKQLDTEPNENEGTAQDLGSTNCGALAEVPGSSEMGDVDYYTVALVDLGEACPNSDGTISIVTGEEDLEVCMFFDCNAGAASVNCGADSDETSEDGLAGCCGTNSVEPDFFCSGVNNDAEVRLRVGGLAANSCVDYALAYRVL